LKLVIVTAGEQSPFADDLDVGTVVTQDAATVVELPEDI
jgi:hypothetical protein